MITASVGGMRSRSQFSPMGGSLVGRAEPLSEEDRCIVISGVKKLADEKSPCTPLSGLEVALSKTSAKGERYELAAQITYTALTLAVSGAIVAAAPIAGPAILLLLESEKLGTSKSIFGAIDSLISFVLTTKLEAVRQAVLIVVDHVQSKEKLSKDAGVVMDPSSRSDYMRFFSSSSGYSDHASSSVGAPGYSSSGGGGAGSGGSAGSGGGCPDHDGSYDPSSGGGSASGGSSGGGCSGGDTMTIDGKDYCVYDNTISPGNR